MHGPVELFSNVRIPREELLAFLRKVGAELLDDPTSFDARLSQGSAHVWIKLNSEEPPDPADEAEIARMLGAEPRTRVLLEIGRQAGSEQIAMDFACAFANRWPSVVNTLRPQNPHIYPAQSLVEWCKNKEGFGGTPPSASTSTPAIPAIRANAEGEMLFAWTSMHHLTGFVGLDQVFRLKGANEQETRVHVDVVAGSGTEWYVFETQPPFTLGSPLWDAGDAGLLPRLRALLEAARQHPISGMPPRITVVLTKGVSDAVRSALGEMGVGVESMP